MESVSVVIPTYNRARFLPRVLYLAAHGERFRRRLAELHRMRAAWLLRQGRGREARAELPLAEGDTSKLRLLALLPGPLVRWVGRAMDGRDS